MPAFLVPFVFVCDAISVGLLGTLPKGGSWVDIAIVTLETLVGIAVLGFALQGRLARKSTVLETTLFFAAGILLGVDRGRARLGGSAARLSARHRLCACSDWGADAMDVA
jgi:TRAP-type uncharacterized transport system fused permease subunit